jgi:hypothetical protein
MYGIKSEENAEAHREMGVKKYVFRCPIFPSFAPVSGKQLFVRIEYKLIVFGAPDCRILTPPVLTELMVTISKIRQLINASHGDFPFYSLFVTMEQAFFQRA